MVAPSPTYQTSLWPMAISGPIFRFFLVDNLFWTCSSSWDSVYRWDMGWPSDCGDRKREAVGLGPSSSMVESAEWEPKVETVGINGAGLDKQNGNIIEELVDNDKGNNAVKDNDLNQ